MKNRHLRHRGCRGAPAIRCSPHAFPCFLRGLGVPRLAQGSQRSAQGRLGKLRGEFGPHFQSSKHHFQANLIVKRVPQSSSEQEVVQILGHGPFFGVGGSGRRPSRMCKSADPRVRRVGRLLAGPVGEYGVSRKGVNVILQRGWLGRPSGTRCSRQGGGKAAHSRLICIFSLWRLRGAARAVRRRLGGCSRALRGHSESDFWASRGTPKTIFGRSRGFADAFSEICEDIFSQGGFSKLC